MVIIVKTAITSNTAIMIVDTTINVKIVGLGVIDCTVGCGEAVVAT